MEPDNVSEVETTSAVGDAPRRVSHYEILAEIGRGGMGVVYRARNLSLDLEVALKRPSRELVFHPRHLHRFTREARTLARLCHPNIVRVHDAFEVDGIPWLVLDLVDGSSLRETLRARDGPLPTPEILQHTIGLAGALQTAHDHRIVHRDVTPGNVLIGRDGIARLTDFGLARWYAPVDDDREPTSGLLSTQHGTVVGTPSYMSPEQVIGDRLDGRSDLFSLGVVAYEMATGRSPFRVEDEESVRHAILQRDPGPMSRHNPRLPERFEPIIRKSLAKNREERYRSAAEMIVDLQTVGGTRAVHPEPPARTWRRFAAIAASVAVVGLAGWGAYKTLTGSANRPPEWNSRHLTTDLGVEYDPAVSPDGTLVAFASDRAGNADVWLVDTRGGEPRQLTFDPAPDRSPAWFPDGSALAFTREREDRPSIWTMPRLGGSALPLMNDAHDPAVSPDGKRLAFVSLGESGPTRIAVASLDGAGGSMVLTDGLGTVGDHRWPAWSPESTRIAFNDGSDVWVVDADGGNPSRLTEGPEFETHPCWSSDGRSIYYASQRGGTVALWAAAADGGTRVRLTPGTGPERSPGIAANGSVLAYSSLLQDSDLIVLDRETGARERISGSRVEGAPTMAPDGAAVVYGCDRLDTWDLWLQPLRGGVAVGAVRRLTDLPGSVAVPQFSPDGLRIAFANGQGDEWDLWEVPVSGGLAQRLTRRPGREVHPRWSPDMTRLAFVSRHEDVYHVWIAPYSDGRLIADPTPWTAGVEQARFPEWSPDGAHLAFLCALKGNHEVCIVSTDRPAKATLMTRGADARFLRWDRASGRILVAGTWGTSRVHLRWVDPEGTGSTAFEPVVTMGGDDAYGDFDVSGDGRYVVYDQDATRGDIWILEARNGRF